MDCSASARTYRDLPRIYLLLLRDPDLRRRMGEAGRTHLLQHFNQKAMHDHYANLYDQMLDRGANGLRPTAVAVDTTAWTA